MSPGSQERAHSFCIRLGNALGDDLGIALLVAGISAIFALVSTPLEKELVAEGAEDDLVELTLNELVAVHLVDFSLSHSDSATTA